MIISLLIPIGEAAAQAAKATKEQALAKPAEHLFAPGCAETLNLKKRDGAGVAQNVAQKRPAPPDEAILGR